MSKDKFTIQISSEINTSIEEMAQATERPKDDFIEETLNNFIKMKEWQKKAIDQTDRGEGIPFEEVMDRIELKIEVH